jgi:hypothetical protein
MEQLKNQEQIAETLANFQHISRKVITCVKCNHTGVQGLVSGNFFNWMTLLGLAGLLMVVFTDLGGWIMYITGPFLIIWGAWKSNKFQCPSCGLESSPMAAATINPIHKKK